MTDGKSQKAAWPTQDELINQSRALAASIQRLKPALDAWGTDNFQLVGLQEREAALHHNWAQ